MKFVKAVIYRSELENLEFPVPMQEVRRGFTQIKCQACEGSGMFEITEKDSQKCVRCSGRGKIGVTL